MAGSGSYGPVSDRPARRRTTLLRTVKSCGPDAPTLASSLAEGAPAQQGWGCAGYPLMLVTIPSHETQATCHNRQLGIYDYSSHFKGMFIMREIQLRDAKANLSAVVDEAMQGKPAVITRHGKPQAVVVSYEEWERLSHVPTFGRLLMSAPSTADDLPGRNRSPLRKSDL